MKISSKLSITLTAVAGFALTSLGSAFAATDHPPLNPGRDAVVTYKVEVPVPGKEKRKLNEVKVSFEKNGDRLRIDQIGGTHVTILDKVSQKVVLLDSKRKVFLALKPQHGLKSPFLLDLSMDFKSKGPKEVAGQKCTEWSLRSKFGAGKACVTDDGVILEEKGIDADGQHGEMTALSVSYSPLPASTFQTPKGYKPWSAVLEQRARSAKASGTKH